MTRCRARLIGICGSEWFSAAPARPAMARLEGATATYRAELGVRLARAETQAGAHAETLSRIYGGRWWRLRGVLLGLRARVRRWR
jgi:hypothetical protein